MAEGGVTHNGWHIVNRGGYYTADKDGKPQLQGETVEKVREAIDAYDGYQKHGVDHWYTR